MDNGLSKKERISSVKAIENLIARGRYANLGVIRVCHWQRDVAAEASEADSQAAETIPAGGLNRIMVSVPKKLFKRAVKRNLLKRRIREAYRLQKHTLDSCTGIDMMFVYNSKEVADFAAIHSAVGDALKKIAAKYGNPGNDGAWSMEIGSDDIRDKKARDSKETENGFKTAEENAKIAVAKAEEA